MLLQIFALFSFILAAPETVVKWNGVRSDSLNIAVSGHDDILEQCANSGLEVRYRFQVKVCRRRGFWFDSCSKEQLRVQSFVFDPISESYRVSIDQHGDANAPETSIGSSVNEAFSMVSNVKEFPLRSPLNAEKTKKGSYYISLRVISDCKGEENLFLSRISTVLTLGLIEVGTFDSGWMDYDVAR